MNDNPQRHRHSSLRLKGYDYSQAGLYFVTIVTKDRKSLFGQCDDGEIRLNQYGEIVAETWKWLEEQYNYVELGAWIVMPNHLHGILIIHEADRRGGSRTAPTDGERNVHDDTKGTAPTDVKVKPLGRLVGAFKTVSTKKINLLRGAEGSVVWQRNYYDHIIRNQEDLELTWLYIESNPAQWLKDEENPARIS